VTTAKKYFIEYKLEYRNFLPLLLVSTMLPNILAICSNVFIQMQTAILTRLSVIVLCYSEMEAPAVPNLASTMASPSISSPASVIGSSSDSDTSNGNLTVKRKRNKDKALLTMKQPKKIPKCFEPVRERICGFMAAEDSQEF